MIQIAQLSPGALGRGAEKKYINLFFLSVYVCTTRESCFHNCVCTDAQDLPLPFLCTIGVVFF